MQNQNNIFPAIFVQFNITQCPMTQNAVMLITKGKSVILKEFTINFMRQNWKYNSIFDVKVSQD